eukprot:XP_024447982.1 GDSL esterase/lipase At1g71691 [Populus trichocarpa]
MTRSNVASDLGPFKSDISIPALFVFGDSWVDNGNGKYMGNPNPSSAYGVDFKVDNQSRASNGKTMADFIAQNFGLPFLPPFLSLKKSESIQFGANYASSGCGILPETKKIHISKRLQRLYDHGGRKFLLSNSLPLGCRPFSISQEKPTTRCVERLNKLASEFNSYLPRMLKDLESTLSGSKFVLLDVYKVFEDVFSEPASYGKCY